MKKIKLVNYTEPKKDSIYVKHSFYQVYLGNGHIQDFTNLVDVKGSWWDYVYPTMTNRVIDCNMNGGTENVRFTVWK